MQNQKIDELRKLLENVSFSMNSVVEKKYLIPEKQEEKIN